LSIASIARTPRRLHRMTQILQVLARHGFGHVVRRLNLQSHLPVVKRLLEVPPTAPPPAEDTIPKRVTLALEELGPTFVKLGQLLSTRPDVMPEDFIQEFRRLQDHVQPFEAAEAKTRIATELSAPVREVFSHFNDVPRASGSIAQVHDATLVDGTEVVVKVKRPGIDRRIMADLDLLAFLADQAERVPELRVLRPAMMADEFSQAVRRELDFITEAAFTAKFARDFDKKGVRIPTVYWDYTTSSVLTLERLSGVNLSDPAQLDKSGVDRKRLANDILAAFMHQFFETGLFHADPHPGNLLVTPAGQLALVDFGMVGHLSTELRNQLGATLIALVQNDLDLVVDILSDIGVLSDDTDLGEFKLHLTALLDKYYGIPAKRIDARDVFTEIMRIAREHGVLLPRDFVLLGKSLATVTSIARQLSPDVNLAEVVAPHATSLIKQRFMPGQLTKSLTSNLWHLSNMLTQVPRDLRQILKKFLAGKLQMAFRHQGLENFITELDRSSNRLAFSIIVASIVIGSSLIIHAKIGPMLLGNVSLLGFVGYAVAFLLGVLLMIAILRSGRL